MAATIGDNTDVYVVRGDGESTRRLTEGKATEIDPEWSRDGRWIYYVSDESGPSAIWKMPAEGGRSLQLTSRLASSPASRRMARLSTSSTNAEPINWVRSPPCAESPLTGALRQSSNRA